MRGRWAFAFGVLALPGIAPAAYGPREHEGWFLRLHGGIGHMRTSTDDVDPRLAISGTSLSVGLLAGGEVAEPLILFGEVFVAMTPDPTVEKGDRERHPPDSTASLVGIGPGAAVHIMPINAHVSASFLVSQIRIDEHEATVVRTGAGAGGRFAIGKEWWVSDDWALGAAAYFYIGWIPDGPERWTTLTGGISLLATYD